jgi:hypothetical protein
MEKQKDGSREKICVGLIEEGVAISSALSLALHIFNRIMVSISALSDATTTYQRSTMRQQRSLSLNGWYFRIGKHCSRTTEKSPLTPRTLIIQSSPDRTSDYNALMNCTFAAHKHNVVIDGCFIHSDRKEDPTTSHI